MNHNRLVKALEKHGLKVQTNNDHNYFCIGKRDKVSWFLQDGEAKCVQVMGIKEANDSMTDYFPGFFARTIKIVVEYLTKQ